MGVKVFRLGMHRFDLEVVSSAGRMTLEEEA